jgi:hypothetical protein
MMQLIALGSVTAMMGVVNVLLSPTLRKFPDLKFIWSEGGIGWVPAILERADRQVHRHRAWAGGDGLLPSELFARNMWCCMIEEPIGLKYRDDIGINKIVWECDYPHADTPWPDVQQACSDVFRGVSADDVEAITHGNAERLFRWQMADPALALGNYEPSKAPLFDANSVRYSTSLFGQRCKVMVETGSITETCGQPVDEDGRCAAGHTADQTVVAAH